MPLTVYRSVVPSRVLALALLCLSAVPARAQTIETAGSRALGMGGAFVAVASDSSATWWNPAGLAAGRFVDLAWAGNLVEVTEQLPAWRHRTSWFAVGTPPLGAAYYRFRITDIQPPEATGPAVGGREGTRAGASVHSLVASQLGVTLVRTLMSGVHAGTTLKYLRGTVRVGPEEVSGRPSELLTQGEALGGSRAENRFDLDVGVIAVAGSVRVGAVVRNVRAPEFSAAGSTPGAPATSIRLPRQIRVGAAFDPELVTGVPLTIAFDADARAYATSSGMRQVVAFGAEYWLLAKRVGARAGGRVNTRGASERSATAGLTVALRGGLYLDGHAVRGGSADERGWGLGARVSF